MPNNGLLRLMQRRGELEDKCDKVGIIDTVVKRTQEPQCIYMRALSGLSLYLFNLLLEAIMQWALTDNDSGVRVDGQLVSNLRFADDIDRRPASRPYRQSE